ncbi:related to phospholipase D [Cephalotrichum gorgonifer]|uniref:Phospholipase D1 n=1 Tax=Cephalotrichum gorgonifer TaxID=2041049 RepID=A0AAE8SRR5_9PEZI|nr:related to phospholipase D [Cephalotrichum gorgonifer]
MASTTLDTPPDHLPISLTPSRTPSPTAVSPSGKPAVKAALPRDAYAKQGPVPHAKLVSARNTPGLEAAPNMTGAAPPQDPSLDSQTHLQSNGNLGSIKENGDDIDVSVPQSRRSVQFARSDPLEPGHSRHPSLDDPEVAGKNKASSFILKLKALAGTGGLQTPRSPTLEPESGPQSLATSPTTAGPTTRAPQTLDEANDSDADADADAEETADESAADEARKAMKQKKKRARKMRRPKMPDFASTPSTPIFRNATDGESPGIGRRLIGRRASLSGPSERRGPHGAFDGDGREDPSRDWLWRRGTPWASGAGAGAGVGDGRVPGGEEGDEADAPNPKRLGHFRRITYFGGGASDVENANPKRPFFNPERAASFAVPRWPTMLKSTLKMWRAKKDDGFDYSRSAELMAELRAGAPAVLMLASMIQRDEHGNKRIPVLLEQLKVRVTDSTTAPDADNDRHWIFTLDLEYGSGASRMKWRVTRTLRDIYELHLRYKFAFTKDIQRSLPGAAGKADVGSRRKQPKFPLSTFPYLRSARGFAGADESDDEGQASVRGDETGDEATAGEGTASEMDIRGARRRPRIPGHRRLMSTFTDRGDDSAAEGSVTGQANALQANQRRFEKQRRLLEKYLQEMIRWLMFRADSNRLCRFLELSALGVRLGAEGTFHGKECYLHIQSSKGLDFRRVLTPKKVIARHGRKWFLIRESYIVCVESPENMIIYDVYLVDSKFEIVTKNGALKQIDRKPRDQLAPTVESRAEQQEKHHTLTIRTSERTVKLFSRKESVMMEFEDSVRAMLKTTLWHGKNRFGSFAPVRQGVFAEWLVDGRDYMWNVSRAISMARDVIYIHDWWLSPELYMRRPAAISQKWRLDRLLQRKAREGVKVFVIVYRNIETAIPIDSEYTKISLHNLHPNIFVQRSPNQFKKNQLFFAHHEKLCIVDHDIAFMGGIDLCFGRWDCPQHPLSDDVPTGFEEDGRPSDPENCQVFIGKDYSNPRVRDFFRLHEPYDDMYDRTTVPRMPWHDVGMQMVGQPARDLTRHFVQRWNYLRRGRKPTRALPFLLPPPDAKPEEFQDMGLSGTCEVQILRSAALWSLGIDETEMSIQNAYVKIIEDSDHLIYIENQFFVTSTQAYNTKIVNRIGDALVDRIVRAYQNGDDWKCFILIPLMPGFESTVDEQPGMSVRLIVQFQYHSICRGENSIFERLRAVGIDPEEYIQFYSLRKWGKLSNNVLVTEQLYIHAKIIIADDRVALIGSANINERSLLGNRDSEIAAVIRDTDMIWSTMGGKPYQVARFAHTLRMRLMREHLGLDVDEIEAEERQKTADQQAQFEEDMQGIYSEEQHPPPDGEVPSPGQRPSMLHLRSFNRDAEAAPDDASSTHSKGKQVDYDPRVTDNPDHEREVAGLGTDHWKTAAKIGTDEGRDSVVIAGREVLVHNLSPEGKGTLDSPAKPHQHHHHHHPHPHPHHRPRSSSRISERSGIDTGDRLPPLPPLNRRTTEQLGLPFASQLPGLPAIDDTDIGGPPAHHDHDNKGPDDVPHPLAADIKLAYIDKDCMRDPLNPTFLDDIWNRTADNNTKLYRQVFRCMPDSEVKTWAEYRDYTSYAKRFHTSMTGVNKNNKDEHRSDHFQSTADLVSEKPVSSSHEPNPAIVVPEKGETGQLDEKRSLWDQDNASHAAASPSQGRPPLGLDVERVFTTNSLDHPSPVLPAGDVPFPALEQPVIGPRFLEPGKEWVRDRRTTFGPLEKPASRDTSVSAQNAAGSVRRRRRGTTKGSRRGLAFEDMLDRDEAEDLLNLTRGNLVHFPYDWLVTEESNNNWGFHLDGMAPISI